jgi:hypothetical protein
LVSGVCFFLISQGKSQGPPPPQVEVEVEVEVEAVGVPDFAIQFFYEFCHDMRSSSELFAMCQFFSFYARKNYSGEVGLIFKERYTIFCHCSSFLGRKCMVQGFLDIFFLLNCFSVNFELL